MDTLMQDIRYAVRVLLKTPGFAAVALVTLALGIGANTAIFSVVNAVLLQALPFRSPNQLVLIREATGSNKGFAVSVPNFEDYREQQKTFENLSLWIAQSVNLTGVDRPDRLIGSFVSDNFFRVLDVKPLRGRDFVAGEDQPGAEPVALIGYGTWKNRFGGDPDLLGKKINLNNEPYSVVGILPAGFVFPMADSDVWVTIGHYPNYRKDRASKSQLVVGRIKNGVSYKQAIADLNVVANRLANTDPQNSLGIHIEFDTLKDLQVQSIRPVLVVLMCAVGLILLTACANVANLLLARGAGKSRELAVRVALGANSRRIAQQLLIESLILALVGGATGILIAQWGLRLLLRINPLTLPSGLDPHIDLTLLLFAIAASVLTGILCGVIPVLQFSRPTARLALGSGCRAIGQDNTRRHWLRAGFVVSQVAISFILLVASGLLLKSFRALLNTNPGFTTESLLTMEYRLPRNKYSTTDLQWNFHRTLVERVQGVPGVTSAALVQALPFSGNGGNTSFLLPGLPAAERGQEPSALTNLVTPEYFLTIGIPLLRGRTFTEHDDSSSPAVVVINQSMAQKYWPNEDPIGRLIRFPNPQLAAGMGGGPKEATVIGIVGDTKQYALRDDRGFQIYFSYAQTTGVFGTLLLHTAVDPMSLSNAVREAVWSIDKDQPVWKIRTMEFLIDRDLATDRALMFLMAGFSILALVLTGLGTYGVISYSVTQRVREMGVRIALGARPLDVVALVVRQGLVMALLGSALGLAGAFAATGIIRKMLFGVNPTDPAVFAAMLGLLIACAGVASWLPARRAAKVDPMVALRFE